MSAVVAAVMWAAGLAGPPSASLADVQRWLDDLGAPAFEQRRRAVEALYAAGPGVLQDLERLTTADDFEAALQARAIISRIERLYLVGAKVELRATPQRCRWDEPVTLTATITNDNGFPIRLPFLHNERERLDRTPLARQVGSALDLADFLEVVGPDGSLVSLTVDDFRGFGDIEAALDARVFGEPSSWLAPGARMTLTVPAFNRGVARFRLLRGGVYRLRFKYVPEWDVAGLRDRGAGLVESKAIELDVHTAAPAALRGHGPLVHTALHLRDGAVEWEVRNVHDRPLGINTNFGPRHKSTHAHLLWMWDGGSALAVGAEQPPLKPELVRTLAPNDTLTMLRVPLRDLRQVAGFPEGPVTLRGRFGNLLDRALMQRHMDGADLLRWSAVLPLPTFVGHSTTAPLLLPAAP